MEFIPAGKLTLIVPKNRISSDLGDVIEGYKKGNGGSVSESEEETHVTFGPCMGGEIALETIEKNLPHGEQWLHWLQEMHTPKGMRYMVLDGQQVMYVTDEAIEDETAENEAIGDETAEEKKPKSFLCQINHGSWMSQHGPSWRSLFPEKVWGEDK